MSIRVVTFSGLLGAATASATAATTNGSFLHDRLGLVVAATAAAMGVAVRLSRSFSGGTASARATAATTGGRCRLIVATAATRTATAAATVNRAAGGAACVAVTHEVHAEVGEVAQVTCESVASTGAGNDDAAVA